MGRGDLDVVGLTDEQRLICFEEDDPGDAEKIGKVRGLDGDERVVGIDYRPATGDLYGLGNNGGVYVIDDESAHATLRSRLNVALNGSSFGVDFNPTVDRLRIVSGSGQNLRDNVDLDDDTLTDGMLTYPGPPPVTATGVGGAAYTNNDSDPNTATTLYDIDSIRHLQPGPERDHGRRRGTCIPDRGRPEPPLRGDSVQRAGELARRVLVAAPGERDRDPAQPALSGLNHTNA